ncbi:FIST N-terminal domain-containing protein [Pseudokineococcus sp. 5B2Z-1]|uniref:FIST signal transduction protein n=1 Tax=Pseudokineococcus sp. 5B2Z-1 TaxID=3132744 RepID=UPI0030984835
MGDSGDRWMATSQASAAAGARRAGAEAARRALAGRAPALVVVQSAGHLDHVEVLSGVRSVTGEAPLLGGSATDAFGAEGPATDVVVTALGGPGLRAATAASSAPDVRARGAEVARALEHVAGRHRLLLLLPDGLDYSQDQLVRGVYDVAGPSLPVVGGGSSAVVGRERTALLHGGEVRRGGVVAAVLAADRPFGVGAHHGMRPVGDALVVTGSTGLEVRTLDGEPALDAYLARLSAPSAAHYDASAFAAFAQLHPLGLARRRREEARVVVGADLRHRTLQFVTPVPQGGLVRLMEGDAGSVLQAARTACDEAVGGLGDHAPAGLVVFSCVARRQLLGEDGVAAEVASVREVGGSATSVSHSFGEIARTSGYAGCHNQTLVALAV